MDVYIRNQRIRLDPSLSIGKGGEADVFLYNGVAVKVFKPPTHPDYQGFPLEQSGAKARIAEHQQKLRAFPRSLPKQVIAPLELAYDRTGATVLGYTMAFIPDAEVLLRYADKSFRNAGVPNGTVVEIFRDLHSTINQTHAGQVVIGDCNDLNVLVKDNKAYLIDADSYQFGKFFCRLYTARFVDPTLCDPQAGSPTLVKPYTPDSDWYAFSVMLMQCLLFVHPYGGIHAPKDKNKRVLQDERSLRRITVFDPSVIYPKPATPYSVLPDELLDFFQQTFAKDRRGLFPLVLLERLRWTTCTSCGKEHARTVCPFCKQVAPAAIKEMVTVRGTVTATRMFRTSGHILCAAYHGKTLQWLVHENGTFKREANRVVIAGDLDPQVRYRLHGDATLMGKKQEVITLTSGAAPSQLTVEAYGNLPMFDANADRRFWVANGHLMADGKLGPDYPERIGEVLSGQTLFWVGSTFGFGFYRAGNLCVAFVFSTTHPGINDSVKIPAIVGQLIDATAVFTSSRCWFFTSTQHAGKITNHCTVIRADGTVEATVEAQANDGSWLGTIRGHTAAGPHCFAPTDDGVVRVEVQGQTLAPTKTFPDTEPFVNANSKLFVGPDGLYVVNSKEIYRLQIK